MQKMTVLRLRRPRGRSTQDAAKWHHGRTGWNLEVRRHRAGGAEAECFGQAGISK
jgi:hypothetical protein